MYCAPIIRFLMSCALGGISYFSASSTERMDAMPCTRVHTPQIRCTKAQASRGSRPRMMISIPRTIVPDEYACWMRSPSICTSTLRWPSMRVIGSTTTRLLIFNYPDPLKSFAAGVPGSGQVVADQVDKVHNVLVPVQPLFADLKILHTGVAGGNHRRRSGALDLFALELESRLAQALGTLQHQYAAAAAATQVGTAVRLHLRELDTHRLEHVARLVEGAAEAADLAGIVEGHVAVAAVHFLQLQPPGLDLLAQVFRHRQELEWQFLAVHRGSFPAQHRVGVTALGDDDFLGSGAGGRVDDALADAPLGLPVAGQCAEISGLETVALDGPVGADL